MRRGDSDRLGSGMPMCTGHAARRWVNFALSLTLAGDIAWIVSPTGMCAEGNGMDWNRFQQAD